MDEQSMSSWWNEGLSGEDRDEWCAALDTGVVGEDLLITLTAEQRAWLENAEETTASMGADLQAFVAEECSKRLR
ncbi:hypothetical protein AB0B31_20790 [Catellatospora citrea]|uniref:hypothetical protein n=1 Tax=Catellatospora citrea TaxID=53366 RepID=UPI0033E72B34